VAAGQSQKAAETIAQLIRAETLRGGVPSIEWELALVESSYHGGLWVTTPTNRLGEISIRRTVNRTHRLRAAKLQLFLAENTVDASLAHSAIASITDLQSESPDFLLPHLVYHTVFGDIGVAVSIAAKLFALGVLAPDEMARHTLLSNAGIALWRGGQSVEANEAWTRSYRAAEAVGLWSGCAASASLLAGMYWYADDHDLARRWLQKAGAHLARTSFPDHGSQYYANAIMFALADGSPDEAERLLTMCRDLYPNVLHDRRAIETLSFETRICLARGFRPDAADVDRLVAGHLVARASGVHDVIADTVVAALESIGRYKEAAKLRKDYLTIWRRDRFSPTKSLQSLSAFAAD
jgi:hypothetical protein